MLPDQVSNPGPLTYESGALPIALRGPAFNICKVPRVLASVFSSFHSPPPHSLPSHSPRDLTNVNAMENHVYAIIA